jgi:hypothetical protein
MAACAVPLAACATITKGTSQLVAIDTPGVAGAVCTINTASGPLTVTTPGTVTLSKGSASLPIQCAKECYVTGTSVVPSNAEAMAAGNVIFGGVIGLGVDAVSGALNKYPDQVTVAMSPVARSGLPEAAAGLAARTAANVESLTCRRDSMCVWFPDEMEIANCVYVVLRACSPHSRT